MGNMKPGPFARLVAEAQDLGLDVTGYNASESSVSILRSRMREREDQILKAAGEDSSRLTPEEIFDRAIAMMQRGEQVGEDDVIHALRVNGWKGNYEVRRTGEGHAPEDFTYTYTPHANELPVVPPEDQTPEGGTLGDMPMGFREAGTPGTGVERYVDKAMFESEEFSPEAVRAAEIWLLHAGPDPLGAVAAMSMMYEGRVIRDLTLITDDERKHYFDECFKTTLKAPLEAIDFHFMVEGVTRAHSHQEVRQRTAVFAQESMRFAVKENLRESVRPQPSISATFNGTKERERVYYEAIDAVNKAYKWLIADGVPAEDARGLLPHDTLTRLHHKVNLRNLMDELGKRTCTQAQFEWRIWAAKVKRAIADFDGTYGVRPRPDLVPRFKSSKWQFEYISNAPIFQPICFHTGQCMFKASMDRGCTIRERVEAGRFDEIDDREWAQDPTAAWVK